MKVVLALQMASQLLQKWPKKIGQKNYSVNVVVCYIVALLASKKQKGKLTRLKVRRPRYKVEQPKDLSDLP